jgi:hypothetical protein
MRLLPVTVHVPDLPIAVGIIVFSSSVLPPVLLFFTAIEKRLLKNCNVKHSVTNCTLEFLYVMCSNTFSVFLGFICYAYSTPVTALSVANLRKTIKENHVSAFLCHHVAETGPRKPLSRAFFWVKSPGYKTSRGVV